MPELPEVEITARLIGREVAGLKVTSASAPGIGTLKSVAPSMETLVGQSIAGIRRRGKHLLIDFSNDSTLLLHLMSAGRLQLFSKKASPRDRTTRLNLDLEDGRQLRLREFGTRHSSWAKLLLSQNVENEDSLATLGPEALPAPANLAELLKGARPLNAMLRDQRVIAGIGRSWADEILHAAKLSPFKSGGDLPAAEVRSLRKAIDELLSGAIAHYEKTLSIPIPDKYPMPLRIHRHNGSPCPRCDGTIEAVFYEQHTMCYCPRCQTEGKLLKDRRLSKFLK